MSGAISKLGLALTIIFVISLIALFAEIFYVLWRRRVFRRQVSSIEGGGGGPGDPLDHSSVSSLSPSNFSSSSKELFYFFCLKPQSPHITRIEPSATPSLISSKSAPESPEVELIDLMKLQTMYGPSRVLFTIKEEEKEDVESHKSLCSSSEKETRSSSKRMTLKECFDGVGIESPDLTMVIDQCFVSRVGSTEATPFSTPCASPLYFTPSNSPIRGEGDLEGVKA